MITLTTMIEKSNLILSSLESFNSSNWSKASITSTRTMNVFFCNRKKQTKNDYSSFLEKLSLFWLNKSWKSNQNPNNNNNQNDDGLIKKFEDHADSVYSIEWSPNDPWIFASLSYDGRLIINKVPDEEKMNIFV